MDERKNLALTDDDLGVVAGGRGFDTEDPNIAIYNSQRCADSPTGHHDVEIVGYLTTGRAIGPEGYKCKFCGRTWDYIGGF